MKKVEFEWTEIEVNLHLLPLSNFDICICSSSTNIPRTYMYISTCGLLQVPF